MLRTLTLLERRADLSHEEFLRHWREVHAPLARALPGLLDYTQREVLAPARVAAPGLLAPDGVAELVFADRAQRDAAYLSPAGVALMADGASFVGRGQSWEVSEPW